MYEESGTRAAVLRDQRKWCVCPHHIPAGNPRLFYFPPKLGSQMFLISRTKQGENRWQATKISISRHLQGTEVLRITCQMETGHEVRNSHWLEFWLARSR